MLASCMQGAQGSTTNLNGKSCLSNTTVSENHQFVECHLSCHDCGVIVLSNVRGNDTVENRSTKS